MKKHYTYILILTAFLLIGLSACEMKASTPPPTTSAPLNTDIEMETMQAEAAIVQTNVAKGIGEGGAGVEGNPLAGTTITPAVTSDPNAATQIPVPTSTPGPIQSFGVPSIYTIHKGDHPFCLGRRFNINPDDLLAYNNLYRGITLYPGDTLQIPTNARPFPGTRELNYHPTTYTVQSNDTFYTIACYFGDVDPRAIAAHNSMDVSQSLYVGSTIQIP